MDALPDHICPHCGKKLEPDVMFCKSCGNLVPELSPPAQERPTSFPSQDDPYAGYAISHQSRNVPLPDEAASQDQVASPIVSPTEQTQLSQPGMAGQNGFPPPAMEGVAGNGQDNRLRRSGWVTVLALLISLQALGAVVQTLGRILDFFSGINIGNSIGFVIAAISTVVITRLAWGLWTMRLRPWVFWAGLVIELFLLVFSLLNWYAAGNHGDLSFIWIVIQFVLVISLFLEKNIRAMIRTKE